MRAFPSLVRPFRFYSLRPSIHSRHALPLQTPALTRAYSDDTDTMGKDKADKGGYQLKVPKGTKDWDGKDMVIRDKIFSTITDVFKRHGAVTLDTLVNRPTQDT